MSRVLFAACVMLAGCGQAEVTAPSAEPSEATQTATGGAPQSVGECVETTVASTGARLEGAPDSGSAITYGNGLGQVDYSVLPGVANAQIGDPISLCLVSVPENCPPGDDRGRVYTATNLRTNETWTASDSQHSCGGA
ncbi:MAG: hypothetical protein JNM59_11860 [Hyphomonadaceae bacterium]|nr:hypothetical protein [Hyphomonadaceae bacterium]